MPGASGRPYDPDVSDFSTRPVTREDAAAINDLLAAAEAVDRTEEHFTVEDVVEELDNPMVEPARDWLVVERDGQARGSVPADATGPPTATGSASRSTAPCTPATGARGSVRTSSPSWWRGPTSTPPNVASLRSITGSAPSANTDLAAIFARQGLVPERWSFLMEADLDDAGVGVDEPPVPDGYELSTWEGIDHEEMRAAHNVAFVGHYGFTPWSPEMWAQWVSQTRNFRPELSLRPP